MHKSERDEWPSFASSNERRQTANAGGKEAVGGEDRENERRWKRENVLNTEQRRENDGRDGAKGKDSADKGPSSLCSMIFWGTPGVDGARQQQDWRDGSVSIASLRPPNQDGGCGRFLVSHLGSGHATTGAGAGTGGLAQWGLQLEIAALTAGEMSLSRVKAQAGLLFFQREKRE
jgi:hypothetical protein